MKTLNTYIYEGGFFKNVNARIVTVNNKDELRKLIIKTINEQGSNCDLNFIDTSKIEDMSALFYESDFTGDISNWDVSNVKNMTSMFYNSRFNGDISKWDVSKVTNMSGIFNDSKLKKLDKLPNWYK